MARIAVTRSIHALPGKHEQYLAFLHRADEVRRKWGMVESLVLQKEIDPSVLLVIQVWESEERYDAWSRSADRTRVLGEGRHWRVREPSVRFRVLGDGED